MSPSQKASISSCVVNRQRETRIDPSMTFGGSFMASRTWLRAPFLHAEAGKKIVRSAVKIFTLNGCARRNHFDYFSLSEILSVWLGYLLADCDSFPTPQKPRDINLRRMIGNAAHRLTSTMRERQIEQPGDFDGIGIKHLIKVTETEKKHVITMLFLYRKVLHHHRSKFSAFRPCLK